MMTKKELLLALISHYAHGNKATMARMLGVTPQAISTWLTRNTFDIELLYANCEDLNPLWLLSGGEGPMLRSADTPSEALVPYGSSAPLIPVYNAEASAGHGCLRLESEHIVGQIQLPFAKPGDIALSTIGNSMQPEIFCGDILVVRPRQNWREYLETGKIYVVLTDEELYVKVISAITPGGTMVLHSYNPQYPDFEVPLQYVQGVFKVIGIVSQRSY